MSSTTIRPATTDTNSGAAIVPSGTAHGVTSDDSDSTYVHDIGTADELILECGALSLPAGSVVTSAAVRARTARSSAGTSTINASLVDGHGGAVGLAAAILTVNWTSPTTVTAVGPRQTWDNGTPLTGEDLSTAFVWLYGLGRANPAQIRFHEVYVDVAYVEQPVVNVTAPVGPVSQTNTPTVTWTRTLDSDGGAQTQFEVKVFTDAQYLAGGFDPDTSTPFETSGEVSSAAATWSPSTLQPDDTYRAYVRVAQTVNGSLHWSAWDYLEYALAVALPAVPTLTLTEDENDGRIIIDLDDNAGDATTDDFELQRSTDGGTTWVAVRLTTDTAGIITGTSATAYDYEAPNGVATMYRARARHSYSTVLIAVSDWVTGTVTFSTRDVWLKAPERPSLNVVVQIDSYASRQRPARRGVFQPFGRTYPVVVRDTRQSWAGTIRIRLDTDEDQAPIDALLDSGLTLLLQVPDRFHEPDRYVQMGDQGRDRLADKGMVEGVFDTLAWVEVAAPTGVVDAWPAGTS